RLISYASHTMTLYPGDVLSSGTPAGIGSAQTPPLLLKPGSTTEAEIDGLGCQRNVVV
ncbi:MAG: fumarylacetoacetate hydrolase family protein, partial [Verrucomicrobia bacterium]|nr:fumarylacetoacetate hydrolase family protein [Verrucomicrobiota bacterium]